MARPARVIPGLTMTLVGTAFKMKIVNDGTQINLEKKSTVLDLKTMADHYN